MRKIQDGSARCLIYAAVLHTDQSVLDNVDDAYSVGTSHFVEFLDDLAGLHGLSVDGYRSSGFESDGNICRLIRRLDWRYSHLEEAVFFVLRFIGWILQVEALMTEMPEVLILGVVGLP